ncbi:MAG: hypothetical protein GWP04_07465 [Gammaproteobacteria bacterium]|nr:hypothetical protein [Gammaproteobacteria bacterium]
MDAVALTLEAVTAAVTGEQPRVLTVGDPPAIPSGPPRRDDPTFELAVRRLLREQTALEVGYIEQLYTFGDLARADNASDRRVSVTYLALVEEETPAQGAAWNDWYTFFPWEDHRVASPGVLTDRIEPELTAWAGGDTERDRRVRLAFGLGMAWDPIRVLERYELLYEVGLVEEAYRDAGAEPPPDLGTGLALGGDHRRILASALGRLRGKLTYRPVVFEVLPETFTLRLLQRTVEAVIGVHLHTQNFRRLMERERLVEGTGQRAPSSGGRPPELFRFRRDVMGERPRPGVRFPGYR